LNVILNYIFIKILLNISMQWATSGAAIATVISRFVYFSSLMFFAKRKLNIKLEKKYLIKPIISSLIMALFVFTLSSIIKDMNLFLGLILVIFGILIYILVMILIKGLKKEDFDIIKLLIAKNK